MPRICCARCAVSQTSPFSDFSSSIFFSCSSVLRRSASTSDCRRSKRSIVESGLSTRSGAARSGAEGEAGGSVSLHQAGSTATPIAPATAMNRVVGITPSDMIEARYLHETVVTTAIPMSPAAANFAFIMPLNERYLPSGARLRCAVDDTPEADRSFDPRITRTRDGVACN